ncbi:peptidase [Streptomyces sp. LP11]|uniref:Peptidase n=1 Tax=Streptomyces pyxinicus TaxID=2970331 RepID=A0ABT2B4Y4_9ACTN|nr:prenyltransferase/squalene oxidase repeat-containing protein [Streptomyces sp. LP11]MCS0603583.1 peptidase [Streptomyces sp. LP11]
MAAAPRQVLAWASALFVLLAACVTFLTAPPAAADGTGDCTASHGAVVAVDFGPFGGKVERGCDTTPTTGYDLLHDAGFSTTGTQHDGPAFICRIGYGAFNSGTPYPTPDKEPCVLTPQATAYWSYWTASPGQDDWTYSQYGAMDRKLKDGDVDAWVYGGTDVGGTTGEPAFTPDDVRAAGTGTPTPDPGQTPTGAPGKVDLTAAATWLKGRLTDGERIVDDGATTANYPLTADTAYALAATDGTSATLDKITGFLAAHVTDFGYPNGTDQAPDATAVARLALLAEITGRDPRALGGHDLLAALTKNVCAAGPESGDTTPGCTAKGDFRSASYTEGQALSVLALLRADATPPAAAVDRLTQLQCQDGGVTSILIRPGEHCDGDPATTALVALVLHRAGGHDDVVTKARAYLTKGQRTDGAFPGYTGATTGGVTATAYAAQALRALGATGRADAAVGWLSRHQLTGGGFGFEEGDTDPALYATPPAVLAGAGTSLVTLTTKKPTPPTTPPTEPTGSPGTSTPAPGAGPDLKKGVAYLTKAASLKQGRYYTAGTGSARADFGLTIDGAYALAATGLDNAALRGIVDFLDQRGKDGEGRTVDDWTGVGTRYAAGGSIGKTALLAEAVGRDPRHFAGHDLVAALAKAVCAEPSTAPDRSCAAKGAYTYAPSVFAQSLAVMAQLRAGEKTAAARPLAYLESLQQPSGAWPSLIPATGDSDVDSTAIAAMALDLAGGTKADKSVDKALTWLSAEQLADGGFPGAAGDSVNSAALAVQGLSLDADTYAAKIAKAREFLASQQNADGGFNVAKGGQRGSDLRASTQAVGGSTGISFGRLERSLTGTSPQPVPSAPDIVTTGQSGGGDLGTGAGTDGGGGVLAATGVQVAGLAAIAALLVLVGRRTVTAARRRTDAGSER